MLGSGAVIVMDETVCMVKALERLSFFYHEESCGQCTPCREGTAWMYKIVHRIENGLGKPEDIDLLNSVLGNIAGRTICALGDAAAFPVQSFLKHFGDEFAYHIEHKKCLVPHDLQRLALRQAAEKEAQNNRRSLHTELVVLIEEALLSREKRRPRA